MRSLPNIRALNAGIESTFQKFDALERILQPVGDGQLLKEALRRGLIVDDRVSDAGLQSLLDVADSHNLARDYPEIEQLRSGPPVHLDLLDESAGNVSAPLS